MESQPQNSEFRNNPENFHPCETPYKQQRFLTENVLINQNLMLAHFIKFNFP